MIGMGPLNEPLAKQISKGCSSLAIQTVGRTQAKSAQAVYADSFDWFLRLDLILGYCTDAGAWHDECWDSSLPNSLGGYG